MKSVIYLDVPERQIGEDVSVYFPDAMAKHVKCVAVKERKRPERLLPCKCGCKRREHWVGSTPEDREILICQKCRFRVGGKSVADVHRKWNEAVQAKEE